MEFQQVPAAQALMPDEKMEEIEEPIPVSNRKFEQEIWYDLDAQLTASFNQTFTDRAFANKHLADLGQEEESFAVCHWDVSGWASLDKRLTGPDFECGGHKWRILLFPFGNSNGQPNDMVSVYLDYADPKSQPDGWHVCAQFALVISNPNDPTIFSSSRE